MDAGGYLCLCCAGAELCDAEMVNQTDVLCLTTFVNIVGGKAAQHLV